MALDATAFHLFYLKGEVYSLWSSQAMASHIAVHVVYGCN